MADLLGVGRRNRDVALMDPALSHVRIGIVVLPAGEGTPAALAVKVSAIAEENSLWRAQLGTARLLEHLLARRRQRLCQRATAITGQWRGMRSSPAPSAVTGSSWRRPTPVTAPPPLGDPAGVTGASGRYAGFTGEIRELLYPAPPGSTGQTPTGP